MKKRVAIWLFGGIGTGAYSQGQPLLARLVHLLANEFEIVVYSQSAINEEYVPPGFSIVSAPRWIKGQVIRWAILLVLFIRDHFRKKFTLVVSFWGFPGGFLATLAASIFKLPSMLNLQGGDSVGIPKLNYGIMHRKFFKVLATWAYRKATVLTTLTDFQVGELKKNGVKRSVEIFPLGADSFMFKVAPEKKDFDEPYNFLHVSNFNPIKDLETLLKTFAIISEKKQARLRIVGSDYETNSTSELCRNLGIKDKVDWMGPMKYSAIPEQCNWADVMLHTSIYEGQGIVIAEAAMSGLLIAGTRVGLISDLGSECAVIAEPGDAIGLSGKILETLDAPELALLKKRNAHAWAVQHDLTWTVAQYTKIFHDLINE